MEEGYGEEESRVEADVDYNDDAYNSSSDIDDDIAFYYDCSFYYEDEEDR